MASSVQTQIQCSPGLLCALPSLSPSSSSSSSSIIISNSMEGSSGGGGGGGGGRGRGRGGGRRGRAVKGGGGGVLWRCRGEAVQHSVPRGASAAYYAKEMERLSAKESLLLAFKDSGGFQALVSGRTTDMQRIDVNERITALERLNPTHRPTTSPLLEGRWNFEWLGSPGNPAFFAATFIVPRFPSTLVNVSKLTTLIKDGYSKTTANMKLLNSIEAKFILSSKLSVEGPLRMKEEYVEGVFETPTLREESVPEQLRGAFGQAVSTLKQLPVPIQDAVASGLTVPLSGVFRRLFMISYLDEEIVIIRDNAGAPEVLTRLDVAPALLAEASTEYES